MQISSVEYQTVTHDLDLWYSYSYYIMSVIIIDFLLCTVIYLSYVNLTIQWSQFDE